MKKAMTLFSAMALLIAVWGSCLMVTTSASTVTKAADWESNNAAIAAANEDGAVKISFENTPDMNQVIGTKAKYKLDGLYLAVTNMVNNHANKCFNISFSNQKGTVAGGNHILFLINNFGSAIYENSAGADAELGISIGLLPEVSDRQGASILFVKNADGSFSCFAAGTSTIMFTLPKEKIVALFGSEDPEVYISMTDNWYGNGAATGNSLKIRELSTGNTNAFTGYCDPWGRDISVTQTGVLEGITFKHFGNHGAVSNLAKKVPLTGLTLKGITVDYQAMFRFGTTGGTVPENNFSGEGVMVRVDVDGNVFATCAAMVEPTDLIGTFDKMEKVTIKIVKQPDNSFKVFVAGEETGTTFTYDISAEFIEAMYGTYDPMVNIAYSSFASEKDPDMKTVTIEKVVNLPYDAVAPEKVSASIADRTLKAAVSDKNPEMKYTYQWYVAGSQNEKGTQIEGATADSYTIPTGLKAGKYYYYCVVTANSLSGKTASKATEAVAFEVLKDEEKPDTGDGTNETTDGENETTDGKNDLPQTGVATVVPAAGMMAMVSFAIMFVAKKRKES